MPAPKLEMEREKIGLANSSCKSGAIFERSETKAQVWPLPTYRGVEDTPMTIVTTEIPVPKQELPLLEDPLAEMNHKAIDRELARLSTPKPSRLGRKY